jgi:predicted nucleic acid binding AN1-type Zn finger protein
MVTCDECGADLVDGRGCSYCAGTYCADHRLPERHGCDAMDGTDDGPWFGGERG